MAALLLAAARAAADPAADLLAEARKAIARGQAGSALETLRTLRNRHPSSPLGPDSLALAVEAALVLGDDYLARSYLHKLSEESPASPALFRAAMLVAEREYGRRAYLTALEYYVQAVEAAQQAAALAADRRAYDRALLRAAEITLYHQEDARGARGYFRHVMPENLDARDMPLYRAMRVRLVWDSISAAELGLADSNVAALRADGDDLWVGTWNGGVARWSVSSGQSAAFPSPAFSRSIEVTERRIWVGTADGLAWYGKGSGRWSFSDAWKALVVGEALGELYAGTLGDGLFRLRGEEWDPVADGELPGRFVTCLAEGPGGSTLLIGTMNLGLIVMDRVTGRMRGLEQIVAGFSARNVTSVLADRKGRVWIGTYGEGLYLWAPDAGSLEHFSHETGQVGDDWVLAICETPRALYFGTFGAGVSVLDGEHGAWKRFGIADGLTSLDVTSIAARPPYVFFGTLGAGVCVYEEAADGAEL
jgi:ligand-binding sensor domain-containing protein